MAEHASMSMRSFWRLVRHNANFRRLWLAQIVSEMGDWFYMVALYAMLLEFTGRAEVLGIAFVLQVGPQALTGLFTGVINDHFSRKRVMIFTDVARFVIIGCVLFVRSPATVWLIYPLLFIETVMWGMFEPARNAVLPNIVPEEEVLVANTVASTTWSMNLFLGAAVGGVVAVWLGREATIVLDMLTFLVSAWLISRMRFEEPHLRGLEAVRLSDAFNFTPIADGFRYIAHQPRMLSTVLVKAGVGLAGASWVIFPILGKVVFPVWRPGFTAEKAALAGMSALMIARGIGSAFGPLVLGTWAQQDRWRLRFGIFLGFLLSATGYGALGFTRSYPLAYAEILVANAGGAIGWVFSTTLLQMMSDDRFRGRLFSAELACATVMMAATSFVAGYALDRGAALSYVLFAMGLLVGLACLLWGVVGLRTDAARSVQE